MGRSGTHTSSLFNGEYGISGSGGPVAGNVQCTFSATFREHSVHMAAGDRFPPAAQRGD
jgi:hypothetical protein